MNWNCVDYNRITRIGMYSEHPVFKKIYSRTDKKSFIEVDGKFIVGYSHYLQDTKDHKDKWCTYTTNVKHFVVEKYHERLKRMKDCKEQPIFIYDEKKWTRVEELIDFATIDVPYRRFIYTSHKELLKYNSDSVTVFCNPKIDYEHSYKDFAIKVQKSLENEA